MIARATAAAPIGAFVRSNDRDVHVLSAPITADPFGTRVEYYAVHEGRTLVSSSVRALAACLGRVTLNAAAPGELLAFGIVLRDETVFREVRSIPAGATLHPDGNVRAGPPLRVTPRITDLDVAARAVRGVLQDAVDALEPRCDALCAGFTGGRDSRILAALPKAEPDRWHWLGVSGRDDTEYEAMHRTAQRLALTHFTWREWTADFVAHGMHRRSADLANGVGAVSDYTLLRGAFEDYRARVLGRTANDPRVSLWIGVFADGLLARTFLTEPATTIAEALRPRTTQLAQVLSPAAQDAFDAQRSHHASNPFDVSVTRDLEVGWLIRLLTRGRLYMCRALSSFDDVCATQVNPYLHPAMLELGLSIDTRLYEGDQVRTAVLQGLGTGLDFPSAYGYKAPRYSDYVFAALREELRRCAAARAVLRPELCDAVADGAFPELNPSAGCPVARPGAYRTHEMEPSNIWRDLRDWEHLLVYATFLNLVADDGVAIG